MGSEIVSIEDESNPHCSKNALTNMFGWFLQIVLACLAFTCLILKRYFEPPIERRPWQIWWYDTSKQGMGALVVHLANVYLAGQFQGDPCTWYIISFLLDSTVGLLIICIGIRVFQYLAQSRNWSAINFGEYGKPASTNAWLAQCCLYILLMIIVKILITIIIQLEFWKQVREFILAPITNADVEVIFVMLIIPFFVNILIFWVTDNYLMRKKTVSSDYNNANRILKIRFRHLQKVKNEDSGSDDQLLSDDLLDINECL